MLTFVCSLAGWCLVSGSLSAQITPDGTLETEVNTTDDLTEITGGTKANSNLFHSFQDFSLSTGDTAFFNNGLDINNIIGRVTGNNISNIDGLIRANGSANLILINKNGISFGANASLDIGGSFLASTAESVIFEDGTVLNTDLTAEPLITISVPIGLQLGQNSARIEVSGQGHDLSVGDRLFSPIIFGEQWGIRVKPGQTLALLGRGITIDGGVVAAPGGKIELGSVAEGIVDLDSDSPISLSYENVTAFDNLELRSQGLADASGTESIPGGEAGSVIVVTEDLQVTDRGEISVINSGLGDGGRLEIKADTISLDRQGVITAATQSGEGGNILLDANRVIWQGRSLTTATAAGNGNGGNITIDADTVVALENSQVTADAFLGRGGNVEIDAEGSIVCESCQISASSELGIDGVVNIEIESTIIDSLKVLQQPTQPQEEVAVACPSNRGASVSQLTIIGRGGLPNRLQKMLNPQSIIEFDTVDNPAVRENQSPSVTKKTLPPPARSWYKNARGTIVLTARSASVSPDNSASTSVNCRVP